MLAAGQTSVGNVPVGKPPIDRWLAVADCPVRGRTLKRKGDLLDGFFLDAEQAAVWFGSNPRPRMNFCSNLPVLPIGQDDPEATRAITVV